MPRSKEITYRVYYNETECKIFHSLQKAKKFIKESFIKDFQLLKYVFHYSFPMYQDSFLIKENEK